jgi:hypothetical protein
LEDKFLFHFLPLSQESRRGKWTALTPPYDSLASPVSSYFIWCAVIVMSSSFLYLFFIFISPLTWTVSRNSFHEIPFRCLDLIRLLSRKYEKNSIKWDKSVRIVSGMNFFHFEPATLKSVIIQSQVLSRNFLRSFIIFYSTKNVVNIRDPHNGRRLIDADGS